MLIVGDYYCMSIVNYNWDVYNFSGLVERCRQLWLIPQNLSQVDILNEESFDLQYMQYIFSDNERFIRFFQIIMSLYRGRNVFILVTRGQNYDILTESLLRIIRERYGIMGYMLNTVEDFDPAMEFTDETFSFNGLTCLDQDKLRFEQLALIGYKNGESRII